MDVNAKGVFLGTKAAIPQTRRAGGGTIPNISSNMGLVANVDVPAAYRASKGAVRLLTQSTAVQYASESSFMSGSELLIDGGAIAQSGSASP